MGHLEFDERFVVMLRGQKNTRLVGIEGLHQHSSATGATTRSSGYLGQELKRSLGGAKVRDVQAHVRIDYSHEHHVRKIQAFGDHLRAQKDVDKSATKGAEQAPVTSRAARAVTVHPTH